MAQKLFDDGDLLLSNNHVLESLRCFYKCFHLTKTSDSEHSLGNQALDKVQVCVHRLSEQGLTEDAKQICEAVDGELGVQPLASPSMGPIVSAVNEELGGSEHAVGASESDAYATLAPECAFTEADRTPPPDCEYPAAWTAARLKSLQTLSESIRGCDFSVASLSKLWMSAGTEAKFCERWLSSATAQREHTSVAVAGVDTAALAAVLYGHVLGPMTWKQLAAGFVAPELHASQLLAHRDYIVAIIRRETGGISDVGDRHRSYVADSLAEFADPDTVTQHRSILLYASLRRRILACFLLKLITLVCADSFLVPSCQICLATSGLLQCTRCKCKWYCGPEHQRQHWSAPPFDASRLGATTMELTTIDVTGGGHKKVCTQLALVHSRLDEDAASLHQQLLLSVSKHF